MMLNYQTLYDALIDIDFDGRQHTARLLNGYEKFDYGQPRFDAMISWLNSHLRHLNKKKRFYFLEVLCDLVSNAYREGVQIPDEEDCEAECYVGSKGVLIGTRQRTNFFNQEQIELLRKGKKIPSTANPTSGSYGSSIFVESRGILILEQKKAIYVSRFYP